MLNFSITEGLSTFMEVNIQQRPDCCWSVIPLTCTLYLKKWSGFSLPFPVDCKLFQIIVA